MPSEKNPKRRVELQATGHQVRRNVQRLRKAQGMSHTVLATKLSDAGHTVSKTAISEIENGARRVSTDDLTALAAALGVNPNALLLPPVDSESWMAGLSGTGMQSTAGLWRWARGERALWPHHDDAETADERVKLHEHMDGEFKMAIAPRPRPDEDLKASGVVIHGRELTRGDDSGV